MANIPPVFLSKAFLSMIAATACAFIIAGQATNSLLYSEDHDRNTYTSICLWKTCLGSTEPFPSDLCLSVNDFICSAVGAPSDICRNLKAGQAFAIIGAIAIGAAAFLSFMVTAEEKLHLKMTAFTVAVISGFITLACVSKNSLDAGDSSYGPSYGFVIIFTILSGFGALLCFHMKTTGTSSYQNL